MISAASTSALSAAVNAPVRRTLNTLTVGVCGAGVVGGGEFLNMRDVDDGGLQQQQQKQHSITIRFAMLTSFLSLPHFPFFS